MKEIRVARGHAPTRHPVHQETPRAWVSDRVKMDKQRKTGARQRVKQQIAEEMDRDRADNCNPSDTQLHEVYSVPAIRI